MKPSASMRGQMSRHSTCTLFLTSGLCTLLCPLPWILFLPLLCLAETPGTLLFSPIPIPLDLVNIHGLTTLDPHFVAWVTPLHLEQTVCLKGGALQDTVPVAGNLGWRVYIGGAQHSENRG